MNKQNSRWRMVFGVKRTGLLLALLVVLPIVFAPIGCAADAQDTPVSSGITPVNPKHAKLTPTEDKYWLEAKKEVYKTTADLLVQHQAELARGVRYHKLFHGDRAVRQIAITFDDGPHPKFTPQILAVLRNYNVKATFFVVGKMAEIHPELVRAEIAAGHIVGNHTYNHVNLVKTPNLDVEVEIEACGEVIESITGKAPHLFRPPGGDYNRHVAADAEALGYTTVLWTDDPGDYASPGRRVIIQRTMGRLSNGGIILIHDGIQQTVNGLPTIIEGLRSKGYKLVTVDELMKSSKR